MSREVTLVSKKVVPVKKKSGITHTSEINVKIHK